jgi:nitrogen-specific signal transduction histidine kinase
LPQLFLVVYFHITLLKLSNYCSLFLINGINSKFFDPLFTTKPVGSDTGLGLAISYQIVVEKHHGRLTCISQPGQGAELVIEIPLKQGTQQK